MCGIIRGRGVGSLEKSRYCVSSNENAEQSEMYGNSGWGGGRQMFGQDNSLLLMSVNRTAKSAHALLNKQFAVLYVRRFEHWKHCTIRRESGICRLFVCVCARALQRSWELISRWTCHRQSVSSVNQQLLWTQLSLSFIQRLFDWPLLCAYFLFHFGYTYSSPFYALNMV